MFYGKLEKKLKLNIEEIYLSSVLFNGFSKFLDWPTKLPWILPPSPDQDSKSPVESSDLTLQNSKQTFIGLFCVLGNLEYFIFFLVHPRTLSIRKE